MIKLIENPKEAHRHFLIVKESIQNRIKNIKSKGITLNKRGVKSKFHLNANLLSYLNPLLIDSNLEKLISLRPDDFKAAIGVIKTRYPNFFIAGHDENLVLRNIFISHCYESKFFCKHTFIQRIPIDTCPYCNRNYIYHLSKKSEIKPQIDHFYPKSSYPIFAASFYNLIPSCQTCNGFGAKEEKDPLVFDLINPYLINNGHFKFTYNITSINILNPLYNLPSIEIKILSSSKGYTEVFKLDKLYQQHSDHALELIIKSRVEYSQQYRKYLNSYSNFTFNEREINRMIIGNYCHEDEIHKRPLAKLYKDLGEELGLIK